MLPPEFTIRDDFPPASYEQWRALAEADLQGASFDQKLVTHTYEGIDVQPLYCRRDRPGNASPEGLPGFPPFERGGRVLGAALTGWDLRQEQAHPDPQAANRAILEDLEGGVTSLLLRFDAAACAGFDPDDVEALELAGRDGLTIFLVDDLDAVLANVSLDMIGLALDAGAAFLPAAALLVGLWRRRGTAPEQARGALNADPLAVLAREGHLPVPARVAMKQVADLAAWTARSYPEVTAVGVDTSPYHHAGATAAQDIAFATATGVSYLRAMEDAQLAIDAAARQILFRISVGTHHFLSIAKLRAARRLWWRVIEASGGSASSGAMRMHVRTSRRVLTQRDPYVNLLRNTAGTFAAGIGGAESITSVPFDSMTGLPDSFSRRVARNTLLILQEEAHLHRVVDPAGGSWFLDTLTEKIAAAAWDIFQEVERQGGMLAAIQNGWVAEQIDSAFAPRAKDIARRKEGITGISEFPDVREERVAHLPPDPAAVRAAASARIAKARAKTSPKLAMQGAAQNEMSAVVKAATQGASIGQLSRALGFHAEPLNVTPLAARSLAEPFEELRDASDAWQAVHGHRPRIFLANMGPVSHHTARASYAKNFFEAGGFEVLGNDGFKDAASATRAFAESGAKVAVVCSSDKLYPELVPQVAPQLKQVGARLVVLAGNPAANETAWRAAGVDRFIYIKCDVLATLKDILREEGVLQS